ncbi:energy transducer TonB [Rhodoferax sp.]|uniref:energy transducer TonB n=1 Tax=Rhodoferax sp. TaxID=50421 RepID=UPI0025DAD15B|nr:TonB family protein [Rhodoferax sp.]
MSAAARRKFIVITPVLALHMGLVWALQSGLFRRTVELVVPVQMLSAFIETPAPKVVPPSAAPTVKPPTPKKRAPSLPSPLPALAVIDSAPATRPRQVEAAAPTASVPVAAPVLQAAEAGPVQASLELPSSDAAYLQNPKPVYPPLSKRLGEQGQVVYSVLIGADGLPVSARLVRSSGFERLDQASLNAVMRWRYTPGKRQGVPMAMSFNVPIGWVLE